MGDMPELKPCPFCGDPMEVSIGHDILHVDQTPGCPVAQMSWPVEWADRWNTRAIDAIRAEARAEAAEVARSYPADQHGSLPTDPVQCAKAVAREIAAAIMAGTPADPVREAARVLLEDSGAVTGLAIDMMREHKRTLNTGKGGYRPALEFALRALAGND